MIQELNWEKSNNINLIQKINLLEQQLIEEKSIGKNLVVEEKKIIKFWKIKSIFWKKNWGKKYKN